MKTFLPVPNIYLLDGSILGFVIINISSNQSSSFGLACGGQKPVLIH